MKSTPYEVGDLLRLWRSARGLSQMELAHRSQISSRHVSFIENGRSVASRRVLGALSDTLDLSLRQRNDLYEASGYVAEHLDPQWDSADSEELRKELELIVNAAMPFPTVIFDTNWDVLAANESAVVFTAGVSDHLLEPPLSIMTLILEEGGIAERLANPVDLVRRLLLRSDSESRKAAEAYLQRLTKSSLPLAEVGFGDLDAEKSSMPGFAEVFSIRYGEDWLSFYSTLARISSPRYVVAQELVVETFYPANDVTRSRLTTPGYMDQAEVSRLRTALASPGFVVAPPQTMQEYL